MKNLTTNCHGIVAAQHTKPTPPAERGHSCPQQRIKRENRSKFQIAGPPEAAADRSVDRSVRAPLN